MTKLKATLTKKVAGLPLGLWLLLVLVAIALGLFLRNRRSAGGPTAGELEYDSEPAVGSGAIAGTAGGGLGGGGVGYETLPPPPAPEGVGGRDLIDAFGQGFSMGQGAGGFGFGGGIPTGGGMQESVPPREAPPEQAQPPQKTPPPKSGPVPGATFNWAFGPTTFKGQKLPGKVIWGAADKPLFLKHLGARGQSYTTWRANHASAACRVFGDC